MARRANSVAMGGDGPPGGAGAAPGAPALLPGVSAGWPGSRSPPRSPRWR